MREQPTLRSWGTWAPHSPCPSPCRSGCRPCTWRPRRQRLAGRCTCGRRGPLGGWARTGHTRPQRDPRSTCTPPFRLGTRHWPRRAGHPPGGTLGRTGDSRWRTAARKCSSGPCTAPQTHTGSCRRLRPRTGKSKGGGRGKGGGGGGKGKGRGRWLYIHSSHNGRWMVRNARQRSGALGCRAGSRYSVSGPPPPVNTPHIPEVLTMG